MSRNELIIELLNKLDQNIVFTFDVYKDSVTIFLVNESSKTIKFNKTIKNQFDKIFKW